MRIQAIPSSSLDGYAAIPISFMVRTIYQVEPLDGGCGGLRLSEQAIAQPWLKDYDAEETPLNWKQQFDLDHWGVFLACDDGLAVGGAAVAMNTPGVNLLEGRADLAVLWDIRVRPACRGQGVGKALFLQAADWARRKGCTRMKIETQNINVPACKFYRSLGCELGMIHRFGYAAVPSAAGEAMLFWYFQLH